MSSSPSNADLAANQARADERRRPVMPVGEIGKRLSELLGIEQLRRCEIVFEIRQPITAKVEFAVGQETVEGILELLSDGKWQPVELTKPKPAPNRNPKTTPGAGR